jgi:hypothetical protein
MAKKNERLEKIKKENARFEKETPYNFCDRWCERCTHEKQIRCKLYQDELEQKLTCIACGREPDDPEITKEVMKQQFEDTEEKLEKFMEENEIDTSTPLSINGEQGRTIDLDNIDDPEFEKIRKHIEFVKNNPLDITAEQYRKKTSEFLENTFYNKKGIKSELIYDFETVTWYHTLLPVKLHRALCGFHEPVNEDEFGLYDAVAQFEVCKKAINESVKALRKLKPYYSNHKNLITELIALLHNMLSRIETMEEDI